MALGDIFKSKKDFKNHEIRNFDNLISNLHNLTKHKFELIHKSIDKITTRNCATEKLFYHFKLKKGYATITIKKNYFKNEEESDMETQLDWNQKHYLDHLNPKSEYPVFDYLMSFNRQIKERTDETIGSFKFNLDPAKLLFEKNLELKLKKTMKKWVNKTFK